MSRLHFVATLMSSIINNVTLVTTKKKDSRETKGGDPLKTQAIQFKLITGTLTNIDLIAAMS